MSKHATTMVRTYKDTKAYEKDANKLAKDGWRVHQVVERSPQRGTMTRILFGLILMFFPKKKELVVTYTRGTA